MNRPQLRSTCSALRWLAAALLLAAMALHQGAHAQSTRVACPLGNRFCQLQPRFSFASSVVGNKAYYHGGLDANNETRPWADDVLEVVDLTTLEAFAMPYPPSDQNDPLMTRRYRHVMAPYQYALVMAGGQVDDKNGLSNNTLNVVAADVDTRTFVGLRNFTQPGGKADVLFSTVELKDDAMSFISTVMPYNTPMESQRGLRVLNLTDNVMSDGIIMFTSANLQFLKFPLVTHHSLLLDGLPPYLVLEAQRDVTRDYMRTLQQVEPSVIAVLVNPYANTPGEDRQGPLAITFDLPEGLAAGPVGKPSEGYSSGKTLGMQLMPGGGEGRFRLVLWTLSNTTWACGTKCPPGITSGRTPVLASVVSIWDVVAAPKGNTLVLTAAPKHLVVGVPLGLQLGQLVTFHAPFLNAVQVTPGLRASRLLSDMPYVGQVDLNENSDSTNVAMTATEGGFVVRGTAAAPVNCPLWQSGKQTFILNFTLSPKASPVVNGGSLYASGCEDGNVDARGTIKSISKAQMQCGAGTGMYGVTTGDNSARCMAWDATCKQVFYEFWEYDPAGPAYGVLMDPDTRKLDSLRVKLPNGYAFASSRTACVFNNPGEASLYVEYGGQPQRSKGTEKQTPVSDMYAMRVTAAGAAGDGGWQLARVTGDGALPKLAAAAMACGADNTAYIFGGLEDRGGKVSKFVPTTTLVKVKVNAKGVNSFDLTATPLRPTGRGPAARSNHVLVYLAPSLARQWGATQGALLLHGGSNLNDTKFDDTKKGGDPWQKGFQMYSDTWLFDLGKNSWRLLTGATTPVPLMWHSGSVYVNNDTKAKEVVMFGGTTLDRVTGKLDQSVNVMQMDLTASEPAWRAIPMNVTGSKDALKTKYPNAGVCTAPRAAAYLLRQQKEVTATTSPRTWKVSGTSEEVIKAWQAQAINMGIGDVVKVSVVGGVLELPMPMVVPGITVVPGDFDPPAPTVLDGAAAKQPLAAGAPQPATSSTGAPTAADGSTGARRLQQLGSAAASRPAAATAGVAAGASAAEAEPRRARKVLQVVCRDKNTSAFLVTSAGSTLQDISISGCLGQAVSVTASAAGAAPVTLRRVTIADSSSSESSNFHGAALNIAPGADVLLEGCVITRNDASRDGSAIFADVGSRLRLTRGTSVTSNNGTGVYFLGERLALQDAYITGNAAERYGGGIYAQASAGGLERTWVVVNGSVVAGNRAGAGGGGIALGSGARLNLSDSALYRNAAPVGGAVGGLAGSCMVLATRVSFTGNNATQTGGGVNLQGPLCDDAPVQLLRVQFVNNLAGSNGGGLSLLDTSAMTLNITDSAFTRNHAESKLSTNGGMGGGLYAVMWTSRVFLTRTQFTNNTATASGAGAHMFGVNSTLTVVNTTLTGNVAGLPGDATTGAAMVAAAMMVPTRGGGIHVTGASVKGLVVNSTFVQNGASLGAGLSFAPDEGSLVVSNSTRFRLNEAASQGGGLLVGQGVGLLVTNTSFSNNTARAAQGAGGGLCCMRCRNPVLQGCRFRGNAAAFGGGAALLQPTGTSQVVNCRFSANSALVAAPSTTAAGMPSSDESSMGGLRSLDAQYWPMSWRRVGSRAPAKLPLATNATFDSGAYSGGGGLYVSPQAAFNLSGSTFVNNSGLNGGGLLGRTDFCSQADSCMRMSSDNDFAGNTAVKGAGGAVLVTNAALVKCVAGDTTHSLQHCIGGNALRRRRSLLQQQPQLVGTEDTDLLTNQRLENLARGGYGDEMATAATKIILRGAGDLAYCSNNDTSGETAPAGNSSVIRVPPGGGVTVALHLKDALGQCVTGDISDASMELQGRLRFSDKTDASHMALLGNSVRAVNGTATFTALQVFAKPGEYFLELRSPSSALLAPMLLPLHVRACVAGEATEAVETDRYAKYACRKCIAPAFNFDPARNSCTSCDWSDHAECDGAAKVPLRGFYQSHPRNPQIHACLWSGACERTDSSIAAMRKWANLPNITWMDGERLNQEDLSPYMNSMCTPGYTGPLCGACTANHGRIGFQCSQCFNRKVGHYLLYILMWVYLFGMVLVAGWIHVREVMQRHRKREAAATLQLLKPHMLGSVASQPQEYRRHARKRHDDTDEQGGATQPVGKGKDTGVSPEMVMDGNTPLFKPAPRSSKPTDSAFSSQFANSGAPTWVPGSNGTTLPASSGTLSNGSTGLQPRSGGTTSSIGSSNGINSRISSSGLASGGMAAPVSVPPRGLPATVEEASEEAFVTAPESDMAAVELWGGAAPLVNTSSQGTGMSGPSSDAEAVGLWGAAFGSDVIVAATSSGSKRGKSLKANGSARPLGEGQEDGEATYMDQPSSDAAAFDAWASAAVEAAPPAGAAAAPALATVDSDAGMADMYGAAAGQLGSLQQQQQQGGSGGLGGGAGGSAATAATASSGAQAHSSSSTARSGSRWASSQRSGMPTSLGGAQWESYDEAGRGAAGSGDVAAWSGVSAATGGARSSAVSSSRYGHVYAPGAGGVTGSSATHISDPPHLSDNSLVGPLGSASEDTRPQKDMAEPGKLLEGAPALASAGSSGGHRGSGSLSHGPMSRGSKIWRRLLDTEDLDEDARLKIASKASRSLSEESNTASAAAAVASAVMVDRSQKFYVSDIVKLGITHLQMLGIMRLMGLSWPSSAETMLTYADQTLPVVGWLNLDCIVPDSVLLPRPLARALVQLLVPLGALALVVLFWAISRFVNRRRGFMYSDKQFYRPRLVLSVILVLFYLYPSVTNVVVGLFSCTDVDSLQPADPKLTPLPGTAVYLANYWTGETSIQCWRGPHLWMVIFLAIPYLVLFSVGFPLILVWRLYRRRYELGRQSVELRYGFLYESYHIRYYYWESVVLVEKLVLILPVMLLQRKGQGLQVLLAMLVITGASILQITFQPYACKMLDTLQRASFHVLQITLFLLMISALAGAGGIMNLSYGNTKTFTLNILWVVGGINAMLLLLFLLCLYLECKRFALHILGRGKDDPLSFGDVWQLIKTSLFSWRKTEEGKAASAAGKQQLQPPQVVVDKSGGRKGPILKV